ncbi:deoxyribonuclease IV [Mycoplasmopsis columbinasalis]|uniref:Probable endonuclease 4 n=1 Tax=Mycoplasmopsis columbinasalis TaxID=114880 RepID=A0A449B9N9_9BACT|nr:deoxyribonuclease IV [Mycoplasmopsis columbinasalis]VEU77874.1 putative endonuclease 4 [Mycoplasmopsis columbinasalis]
MIKLGSHVPFTKPKYLVGAAEYSLKNGANTMMIFLGAPQNNKRVSPTLYNTEEYLANFAAKTPPIDVIVHAPYIINPANPLKQAYSVDFLVEEIERMNTFGAKYLVLHPGAYTTFAPEQALDTLAASLKMIIERTKDVVICIETMSGKGTEIGINFDQIKYLLTKVDDERVQVCLDTCHMWDAGYNLKDYSEFKKTLKKYDLLKNVKVIHLNDSKNELNSHKDRHENIDQGKIKLATLAKFVHDPDFANIPIILETPIPDSGQIYDQEIAMLLKHKF